MKVRKAVIPAAGLGSRMLPVTKAMPKEMLPVVAVPAIHLIVEEAVAAGCDQILIITNRGKGPIEDYFDYAPDLEERLLNDGKIEDAAMVHNVADMADICFLRQKETKGLGHAIARARTFVGNEPFAILLGDGIIKGDVPAMKQIVDAAEANNSNSIAIREVPDELIVKYSSVKMEEKLSNNVWRITDMNEKPTLDEKLSQFAVLDRYVLMPEIFDILDHTAPGRNNEIQLTDAMKEFCHMAPFVGVDFEGKRYDTGNPKGYLETIIEYGLDDKQVGPWLKEYIKEKAKEL